MRLSRREASRRRAGNESRLERLLDGLRDFGLEPLLLASTDRDEIYDRFLAWADLRLHGVASPW